MELTYSKIVYHTLDLQSTIVGPNAVHAIPVGKEYLRKGYNIVKGFFIDTLDDGFYDGARITVFKIDGKEVLPPNFPIKLLRPGQSDVPHKRYIPLDFPVSGGKMEIGMINNCVFPVPTNPKLNITFKLSNTEDENDYYKNFHCYEVIPLYIINPLDIVKFNFRPRNPITKVVGIQGCPVYSAGTENGPVFISQAAFGYNLAKASLQMNNKKISLALIPIQDIKRQAMKRQFKFLRLDEPYMKSANITGFYQDLGLAGAYSHQVVLVLKCEI
mgnify:CR=1 FL=1